VVGVNKFVSASPKIPGLVRMSFDEEKKQKERLANVKKERDSEQVKKVLKQLENTARGQENIMPAIIECVEAYATIGEICDVLRQVFSIQKEFLIF